MARTILTMLGLLLSLVCSSSVAALDRFDIDRTGGYSGPKFAVVFLARPVDVAHLSPGHTAISLQWEDENGRQSRMESWGFMPTGDKGFASVPGQLINEWSSENSQPSILISRTVVVSVAVDPSKFDAAKRVVREWQERPETYHIFNQRNCNSFASALADALGLKVKDDPNATRPESFVRSIGEAND